MNNNKIVFFAIGVLLIILGAFMLIPFFVQFIYDEKNSSFLASSAVTAFIGILLILTNLEENRKLNLQQAFLLTTLSWLSIAIFGCIPFLLSNLNLSFVDSFFESMSGITTTGSTIIASLDNAPKSILIWRAIMQWLGGIGIIVMAITILPLLNIGGMQLFRMESSDTTEKILPRTREVTLIISIIYLVLTFACGTAYWLVGMNIFDSIAHSMTTIATGGFSTYSGSIGYFQNPKIELVSIIFIILGSIPFIAYLKFVKGDKKIFLKDSQIKGLVYILFISVLLMVISDGAPVDDSTLSVNSGDYLEKHLKQIVKWIEENSNIEILAVGIGHDVTRYYKKAIKIADVQELGDVMINQLTKLFSEKNNKTIH